MNFQGKQFYSNGKLLITGEYVVLYGAESLAMPVKFGQNLIVNNSKERGTIIWKAYEQGKLWFEAKYSFNDLSIVSASDSEKANFLRNILNSAINLGDIVFDDKDGYSVSTNTNFPINWGLGTSSTLINNIAQWFNINPFELSFSVSKGSGYDIACASAETPIIYRKVTSSEPIVTPTQFNKSFSSHLFFVFSGKKMSTQSHVESFISQNKDLNKQVAQISAITLKVLNTNNLDAFILLMEEHEILISSVLGMEKIQDKIFIGFEGVIKSLGAWGGDFLLVATPLDEPYVRVYFEQFGLSTIIPFDKMIKL